MSRSRSYHSRPKPGAELPAGTVVTTQPPRHDRRTGWPGFALWLLGLVERLYLHACGWTRVPGVPEELYYPPDDYNYRRHNHYDRGHAVNAQKACLRDVHYEPAPAAFGKAWREGQEQRRHYRYSRFLLDRAFEEQVESSHSLGSEGDEQ